jgi:uncharacterized membrane protein YfcA
MMEFLLVSAAALLAGFIQGLAGFGSVIVALPAFTMLTGIKTAAPLSNILAVGISLYLCIRLRSLHHWRSIGPLIFAALPGILFGTWILRFIPARYLEISLAATLTIFCLHSLLGKEFQRAFGTPLACLAGFTSGLLGGSIGACGPPIVLYYSLQPLEVEESKSAMSGFFFPVGVGIGISHALGGLIDTRVLALTALSIPSVALGTLLGSACEGKINAQVYRKIMLILLLLFALLLFVKPA